MDALEAGGGSGNNDCYANNEGSGNSDSGQFLRMYLSLETSLNIPTHFSPHELELTCFALYWRKLPIHAYSQLLYSLRFREMSLTLARKTFYPGIEGTLQSFQT